MSELTPEGVSGAFSIAFLAGMLVGILFCWLLQFVGTQDQPELIASQRKHIQHLRGRIETLEAELKTHAARIHNQRAEIVRLEALR